MGLFTGKYAQPTVGRTASDRPTTSADLGHNARSHQAAVHHPLGGQWRHIATHQIRQQASRPTLRLPPPELEHHRLQLRRHLVRARHGSVRPVPRCLQTPGLIPRQPRVRGLPAHPPFGGHLADGLARTDDRKDCPVSLLGHAQFPHVRECQASTEVGVKPQPNAFCQVCPLDSGSERNTLREQRMITAHRRCHEETAGVHGVRED
jgi:hypothetical protein